MKKIIIGLIFVIILLVITAWLASYLTQKYIEKKIMEDLTFPFRYVKKHAKEINDKMCEGSNFLEYPELGKFSLSKKNCYDYSLANFLSILCENVGSTNCFDSDNIPLPKTFDNSLTTVLKIENEKPKYGYMFYNSKYRTTFLIWSGTVTLGMWEKDFNTIPVHMPDYMTKDKSIRVHRGFLNIYEATRDQILDAYEKKYKNKSDFFILAGHSLGGGIAPISAFDLLGNSIINLPAISYSFGGPRSGNLEFAKSYDNLPLQTSMRIANTEDIIPTLPPASVPFEYTHVGDPVAFTINLGSIIANHIEAYITFLPKNLTKSC